MSQDVVQFEQRKAANGKRIGIATLNAPKALNALSQQMIDVLDPKLREWAADETIACVVLQGAGDKAFCAGGDIIHLYESMREHPGGPNPFAERFFETEYRLDYLIHTYPKPVLAWLNGIVMGGGLGVAAGASHKVVTQHSRIAMPELTIGFFPDVGGTWFLNHMPGRIGLYLGLTGANLNAADALYVGLADFFIQADRREDITETLTSIAWTGTAELDHSLLSLALRRLEDEGNAAIPDSPIAGHLGLIEHVTDAAGVAEMKQALEDRSQDEWAHKGLQNLEYASPTSAAVFLRQLRQGRHLSLAQCFQREYHMAIQFTRHPDFPEGIRALLIDKDRAPQWQPATLEALDEDQVAAHFAPPEGLEDNPLGVWNDQPQKR